VKDEGSFNIAVT